MLTCTSCLQHDCMHGMLGLMLQPAAQLSAPGREPGDVNQPNPAGQAAFMKLEDMEPTLKCCSC